MDKQAIGDTLRELRKMQGYQQLDVVKKLNILGFHTTKSQVSRWETGYNYPSLGQFIGLCKIYGIKDCYKAFALNDYSELTQSLNKEGADKVEEFKRILIASGMFMPEKSENNIISFPQRSLPMYDIGASAGTGVFLDSDSFEMVDVGDDVPQSANFGIHVCGDSMEPTLHDGQDVWVHMQSTLENGDIGVFYLDGNAFIKEYHADEKGTFLISHNKNYEPIKISSYNESRIYGKVVLS